MCLMLAAWWCAVPLRTTGQEQPSEAASQSAELEEAERLLKQVVKLHGEHKYSEAIPLAERVLALFEKLLGPADPLVAMPLDNLAVLHQERGDYTRAEPLLRRALTLREKGLGPDHPDVANSLNNLGRLYQAKGDYGRAEPLLVRALSILEKALGPDHLDVATSLTNLATLYQAKGDYALAERHFQRALAIHEKELGPDHPDVAESLNYLAALYHAKGDYVRAEPLMQRALTIYEKARGPDDLKVATSLHNLGVLYQSKGDFVRAEPLLQRALSIDEKALGPDHFNVATNLNSLALLYEAISDYTRAEPLYQRALAIREKVFGPDDLYVATSLNNLAALYHAKGDYGRAEPLYQRALAIREKALGPDHPGVATSLNNLAALYQAKGDYGRAEPLLQRALSIDERALGPDHPDVATLLSNLGALYYAKEDYSRAVQFLSRGNEVWERNLSLILATGSERQKLAYLAILSGLAGSNVSLHARATPSDPHALELSLTTILRRKGRALDAMADQVANLRRRLTSQDRALLDQLSVAQSKLSALVLGGLGKTPPAEHRAAVAQLGEQVEQLQDSISRRSAEFKVQTQPVTIEQVRQVLPASAALVEFFSYRPVNMKAKAREELLGPARYVVYVLREKGEPLWADLGEAKNIDADVLRLRVALRCPQTVDDIKECPDVTEVKRLARAVDERVMHPVRKLLGGTRHIFISPDGALNLLPFATLVDENNKYLIESYSLTYLTSGRDLLRLQVGGKNRESPLVVADPAFGQAGQASTVRRGSDTAQARRSADLMEVNFSRLSSTAEEARALATLLRLPGARVLTQAQATETALKHVSGPQILHVATHGFFLPDQPEDATAGMRSLDLYRGGESTLLRVLTRSENPLLRSGLALARANLPPPVGGEDDGILTALEAAGLDLWGTKLVVLSACETGVGTVKNGEGVYGLRRALVLAGSESQVLSLWQVSDEATRDLMVDYYKRLLAGEGRTEALRQVQLEMLRGGKLNGGHRVPRLRPGTFTQIDYRHPYYWAAFIQSGDWRGLNPQPESSPR